MSATHLGKIADAQDGMKIDLLNKPGSWPIVEVNPTTSQRLQQSCIKSRIADTIVFTERESLETSAGNADGLQMISSGNATIATCKSVLGAGGISMTDGRGFPASSGDDHGQSLRRLGSQ